MDRYLEDIEERHNVCRITDGAFAFLGSVLLASVLGERDAGQGPQVTIGAEHRTPALDDLTIVTANYSVGSLQGTVGVIGHTRMPYDKVVAIVDCTSALVSKLARS